ncbi:hypothetical protein ASG37_05955 [Sphingomonas sp. Leaf407]|uniref:hypothetical protein n=1 Tax=unclassified Sphingomonas TaxID=196159 RepID=UPI0006F782E1|nr:MULTISPECIES: hypothetical protein [unclassified Sphingomonas]KQN34159.1 hypothetical protein ASE97_15890 [Sphingomonas sp. Leaf42]KQT30602.1 hypothetical protein ASG37_05955 [Sphingomonas sp. Leaf407]
MRPAPPLSAAATCSLALWQATQASGFAAAPAPGLWWLLDRFGMVAPFVHLLPVLAAGSVAITLAQPLAHVRHARPWAEAAALAMLAMVLLLPVPIALLVAVVPFALYARSGATVIACLTAAIAVPVLGPAAIGMAMWRLATVLRLPACANDNFRIGAGA